jgi:elongator complex protein 3
VRCREVRDQKVDRSALQEQALVYRTGVAQEHFLSFVTPDDRLAAFLRLSLPTPSTGDAILAELQGAALIRELHVFGQSLPVGAEQQGAAQHTGLGTRLIRWSEKIAHNHGFHKLAVISSVGTRRYYLRRGFQRGELYLMKVLGAQGDV